jgi:di/tricarboxylate transporter
VRRDRTWIALVMFAALLILMTTGLVSTLVAAALAATAMVAMGCISPGEARRSVEWQVLVTIAAAFGVGSALENSGAAATVSALLFDSIQLWGPVAALACTYLLGSLMTSIITNNAAAVLLFPFCLEIARLYGVSPRPFLVALVLAASASFMTPIGYQTNMIIYGPGGYRFTDFLRVGAPLNLIMWLIAVILIPIFWPFSG